jgi:hypothetical protein
MIMIEVTVKISNDETRYSKKYLIHQEGLVISKDDKTLKAYVDQAISEFQGTIEDVVIKIKFTW